MEDDNWLNQTTIECPNCTEKLDICDHSPFEHSCRLYCNSCPKRVDIGMYHTVYDEIEYQNLSYDEILFALEARLANCSCGGRFQYKAKRRCLHCSFPLDLKEEQNVWFKQYWEDLENEEEEEKIIKKMEKFIVEPTWKK